MKEEPITDALLRQFLLGRVDDEKRQQIESQFLTDSTIRERVLAVEQELVEEHLEDSLSPEDREDFLLHYAQTPEQQRTLRITKSIKDWAVSEASRVPASGMDQIKDFSTSQSARMFRKLNLRPVFVVSVAAMVIVAIVFGIIWLNRRSEQQRHFAIEQELAQLNDPSLRDVPLQTDAPLLDPMTLRSANKDPELKLRSDVPVVDLRLRWIRRERYPTYRVVLRRLRDGKAFTIGDVGPENSDGNTLRLRLPATILSRGTYQIYLTPTAAPDLTEEYLFTISS